MISSQSRTSARKSEPTRLRRENWAGNTALLRNEIAGNRRAEARGFVSYFVSKNNFSKL